MYRSAVHAVMSSVLTKREFVIGAIV